MTVPRLAVLVIDDDATILRVFQSVLRDRAACTWSFIDLRMQGTSGLDILRECHRCA